MKEEKIKIRIDGRKYLVTSGQSVLEAARSHRIKIPSLCYHSDLCVKANCRLCLVEIKGKREFVPSCSINVEAGMSIKTQSDSIKRARKINLELLLGEHSRDCASCIWQFNCQLKKLAKEYSADENRFSNRKSHYKKYKFGPSIVYDSAKCIDCQNCVEICAKQDVSFLETRERGQFFRVVPSENPNKDCVYCGQCIVHCPVGAHEAAGEFEEVEKPLKDVNKIVVFQFAPSIRSSIGEEFDFPPGSIVTKQLVAGIRKLGADKVFDVSVGADFTTYFEAMELAERLESGKNLPMFTSCCPAWVRYIELYHSELIPNLTTVRSPHMMLGGVIKTYWAKLTRVNPKDIIVVSIMPCTSKKYEIRRKELEINGIKPVDFVMTTRELAYLFVKNSIDLSKISPEEADDPFGLPSGAGVIYGASGGVMESALRTAYEMITKKTLKRVNLKEVRGMEGIKRASAKINDKVIKVAVANGLNNTKTIIDELKLDHTKYDYVEVMACLGGCIGGGGQPIPADKKTRRQRAESLYIADTKAKVRSAHKNQSIIETTKSLDKKEINEVFYTGFSAKKKTGAKLID